jgi:hypothetical protein
MTGFVALYTHADHATAILGWTLLALVACAVVALLLVIRIWKRFQAANLEALRALGSGGLRRAEDLYRAWLGRWPGSVDRMARHNLAWTRLKQADLDGAVALLVENDRLGVEGPIATKCAVDLAFCHALLGRHELATAWLAESDRRKPRGADPTHDAMRVFAAAVIDCRAGRAVEASAALEERWTEHEGVLSGESIRPMRVVRAFAVAQAGGPRGAGQAETLAALAKPAYPGEYDFLGVAWPEMQAFLAAHSLAT